MSTVIITRSCGTQVPIPSAQLDTEKFKFSHNKNGTPVYVLKDRTQGLRLVGDADESDPIPT